MKIAHLVLFMLAVAPAFADALQEPPITKRFYIDTGVTTVDQSVSLVVQRADKPQTGPCKTIIVRNDGAAGAPNILFTLDGTATAAIVNKALQATSQLGPGESVQMDGQFKTLHYKADAAGAPQMRVWTSY